MIDLSPRLACSMLLSTAILAGCSRSHSTGGTTSTVRDGDAVTAPTITATPTSAPTGVPSGSGPRALPPTFVDLELDRFPQAATAVCDANVEHVAVDSAEVLVAAVEQAGPGTTIEIAPGAYTLHPGEHVALQWDSDGLCLRGDGGPVILQAAQGQKYGLSFSGDDTALVGLALRGFQVGVSLEGRSGETQRDITIQSLEVSDLTGDLREGIVAFGDNREADVPALDGLLLLDVEIDGTDQGVSCNAGPCEHLWVERTRITGRTGSESSGADTFAVEDGRQVVLVDVVMAGAAADGIDTKADDVVVYGARVEDVERNAIKLWRGGDVINALVDGSGADASLVGEGDGRYRYLNVLVAHHDPSGSGYVGTWAYDSQDPVELEIVNSVFLDNAVGGLYAPADATVRMLHSFYVAPSGAKLFDLGGTVYTVGELADFEATGRGEENSVEEPRFVDPAAGDFRPLETSPLRGSGLFVPGLRIDLEGNPRPADSAPDVGPLQFRG